MNNEKDYLENLSSNFTKEELYLLLNSVSVRSLDFQKDIWCSKNENEAKANQNMVIVLNALVEKIKFKIDSYEKDETRKDGVA